MSPLRAERRLRDAIDGLDRLHPDDAEAIRAALRPEERARLVALEAAVPEEAPAPAPRFVYESVSPWLLARIDPEDRRAGRTGREFVLITDAARDALREAAAPFRRQVGDPGGGGSLLDRLWHVLSGGRR